ncbi:MAG: permease-like cell division protein FtsX [Lachnospiraceae bacterium]
MNIKRNKLFSLASVATIAICIFLIGMFYAVVVNFNYMIDTLESRLCVTTFFDADISQERVEELKNDISKRVEVSKIDYTSAEEAWEKYKEIYFGDKAELAEGFKDDNPLADSASFTIYLNDAEMQDTLVKYLEQLEGIRQVNASANTASTLSDFGKLAGYVSVALIAVLLAVGVFLIGNTVMIGITVRKEEIGIMKLMGATDFFIRAPFMVEGLMIGLAGAIIPLLVLYLLYNRIIGYLLSQFRSLETVAVFLSTQEVFKVLTPMALIIGGGIGLFGSIVTMRKHLRV